MDLTKKTNKRSVKLYIQEKVSDKETVLDIYEAKEWDDFILFHIKDHNNVRDIDGILNDLPDKRVIVMVGSLDNVSVYGVELDED